MNPQTERRKHPRVAVNQLLGYIFGGQRGSGRVTDVSLGGIGFITINPMLQKGTQVRVSFQVGSEHMEADVVICRVGEQGLGAYFIKLNDQQQACLERLIAQPPRPSGQP